MKRKQHLISVLAFAIVGTGCASAPAPSNSPSEGTEPETVVVETTSQNDAQRSEAKRADQDGLQEPECPADIEAAFGCFDPNFEQYIDQQ